MTAESLDPSAATTEPDVTEPDGKATDTPGADSAPAVTDPDEGTNRKAKDGFSGRIDELTQNWREEQRTRQGIERDRDYWREQALRNQQQPQQRESERPSDQPGEPKLKTLADFKYDEQAYGEYILGEAEKAAERKLDGFRKEATESEQRETRERSRREFDGRIESFKKAEKITDFDVAFRDPRDGGPTITDAMAETIMAAEDGPALLYHLAKNPQLSADIARMTPLQQAREIGRLESKLAKPAVPKVSGAPPPAPRIDGAATGGSVSAKADSPDSDKLSDAEWAKAREKQLAGRRLAARNRT